MKTRLWSNAHLMITVGLAVALVPAFHAAKLPFRFEWRQFLFTYWFGIAFESIFLAIVLFATGRTKEFVHLLKTKGSSSGFGTLLLALLVPAGYFFCAFLLVICYNDVIATTLFTGSGDALLAKADSFLLGGHSVPQLSHYAVTHFSAAWIRMLQFIYFGLFGQIGSCLVLLAAKDGLKESFRFVATIVTAYYLALLLFAVIPATGPSYGCVGHEAAWGKGSVIAQLQTTAEANLNGFHAKGLRPATIGFDYYIALPCMHLTQPLIVLWFLRKWGRLFWMSVAYDFLLLASVVLSRTALRRRYSGRVSSGLLGDCRDQLGTVTGA